MKNILQEIIKDALKNLGIEAGNIPIEHPTDMTHGDYATGVALAYAKQAGMNPKELAEKIKAELEKNLPQEIEKISIAGPGFINFTLSKEYFQNELTEILSKCDGYGASEALAGKKILIEHSSPNLFKPFHIGHVMNNTIGESITRLAKFSGADVSVISYPSDVSLGIGKAVWAMLEDGGGKVDTFATEAEKLAYLGDCYVRGNKAFEDQPDTQSRIKEITKLLYDKTSGPELSAYEKGKAINLDYFTNITKRLGSHFDAYIFESEAGKAGEEIVRKHIGDVFENSDGAVIYRGEQDGLHTRVFINAEGYPTYEAKDVGLLSLKFLRYNPDLSVFITDHEQTQYFKVVSTAAGKINKEWQEKTVHRTHGRMSFKGQKMSSRLGGVPLAATLLDTLHEEVRERSPETPDERADAIAIAALKFTILRVMAGKNINFDPETSLSFEGDSGPYLQYTVVRAHSVLQKAAGLGVEPNVDTSQDTITEVERHLARFPEFVELSISEWAPHHLTTYLLQLAQAFNSWYGQVKIIDEGNPAMPHNLAITKATAQVITNGLQLLGISVPGKM